MRNPFFFFLILVFSVVNITDAVTTSWILGGEANPLYVLTGNVMIIYLVKMSLIIALVLFYRHTFFEVYGGYKIAKKYIEGFTTQYFILISIVVLGIFMFSLGAVSNIYAINHPAVLAEASKMTASEKIQGYGSTMLVIYVVPLIMNMVSFLIYEHSRCKKRLT